MDRPIRKYVRQKGRDLGECKHSWCDWPAGLYKSGYCTAHFNRKQLGMDMDKPIRRVTKRPEPELGIVEEVVVMSAPRVMDCTVPGCERVGFRKSNGLCIEHGIKQSKSS